MGDKLKELTHQATDLIYGSEDLGPESLRLSLQKTQTEISRIANILEKGEYDFDGTIEEKVRVNLAIPVGDAIWDCPCSFFIFIFFPRHDFVRAISLEPLLAETPN